jgi:MEMO1 family protein
VDAWEKILEADPDQDAGAGIAPHAGWYFSGRLAWDTIRRARPDTETVVVAGGHRPAGASVLLAEEDAFWTPMGNLEADHELAQALKVRIPTEPDLWVDNTVEVHLPLVKLRFPHAKLLWLRVPNDESAEGVGASVARVAGELGRKVFFLASSDLTHYGPSYGFAPHGSGAQANEWVRNVNDKGILEAFLAMDAAEIIRRGNGAHSACSSGAPAAAIGYALSIGYVNAKLCGYYTSWDIHPAESFVGYCSIVYNL